MVVHQEYQQHVLIERGVRQGCRAAPLLWTIFTVDLLRQLADLTDPTWVKSVLTLYADDIHAGQTIHDLSELDTYLCRIGVLFDLLEAAGVQLSPGKSTAMLKIVGREHDHVQTRYTKRTKEGIVFLIPRSDGHFTQIPLKSNTKYLGAKMTYGNVAAETQQLCKICSDKQMAQQDIQTQSSDEIQTVALHGVTSSQLWPFGHRPQPAWVHTTAKQDDETTTHHSWQRSPLHRHDA